jgi:putative transcriptional regulator
MDNSTKFRAPTSLVGQFLVALPSMPDPRFTRAVIFIVSNGIEGTMGIIVNRLQASMTFSDLLMQLDVPVSENTPALPIHYGGPVESGRGFVIHSDEFMREGTLRLDDGLAMTATVDVLRAIALGTGPAQSMLALGYAGWATGQLELEMQGNGWLTVPADPVLIFDNEVETIWDRAIAKLGITPAALSTVTGRA